MHVDIRGFGPLLFRAGTHRIDQTGDSPSALFGVIEQSLDRHSQSDPLDRVAKGIRWQIVTQRKECTLLQSRADEHGSNFPNVSHPGFAKPCCERILRIALFDRVIALASRKVLHNLLRDGNQWIPMLMLKRVV